MDKLKLQKTEIETAKGKKVCTVYDKSGNILEG